MRRISALLMTLILIDFILLAWVISLDEKVNLPQTETVVEKTVVKEPYDIFTKEGRAIVREYAKPFEYRKEIPLDEDTQEYIYYLANAYSIEPMFVTALIEKESTYQPDLVSSTNDYGYMQVNGINKEWLGTDLGVDNLLDPEQNIYAGVYILQMLFEKYEDPSLVLMAYNMGEAGAKKLWEKGIYESNYSRGVLDIYWRLTDEDR